MKIAIELGAQTEGFVASVMNELTDSEVDGVEVERQFAQQTKLINEPLTIGATIIVSEAVVLAVVGAIRKTLELRAAQAVARREVDRQVDLIRILVGASKDALPPLTELAAKFPSVKIDTNPALGGHGERKPD